MRSTLLVRPAIGALLLIVLSGCESLPDLSAVLDGQLGTQELTTQEIAAGLREALEVGSERTVNTLSRPDGFLSSVFHIPLPDPLNRARETGARFGLAGIFDDVEVKLNRAAEAAVPQASRLLKNAIAELSFQDVIGIYQGPDDAATTYLRQAIGAQLTRQMRPIVADALEDVGALALYGDLARQYNRLPLITPVDADLTNHVLGYATDALFVRLAAEEAAIRRDPLKRTTELLRKVFGA